MIYDAENMFYNQQDLSKGTTSKIIDKGAGDAYDALWVHAMVHAPLSGVATITIQSSDKDNMGSPETLATIKLPKEVGSVVDLRLPAGGKRYLNAIITGATTGTLSVGLTLDAELK